MEPLSHDFLFYESDKEISNIIGNETIFYSNKISKISSYNIKQDRNILITNESIYVFQNKKFKNKMKYEDIRGISFSNLSNEFIIHGEKEYDLHFFHQDKEIIIYIIIKCYEKNLKKPLILCEINEKNLKAYVTTKKDKKKDSNSSRMDESKAIDTQTYIIDNDPIEKGKRSYTEAVGGKMSLFQNLNEESPLKINIKIFFSNDKDIKCINLKDFNYIKIIGRGNITKIFLVEYKKNKNSYALKSVLKNIFENNTSLDSKAKLIQNLNHPFLINIDACFETDNIIYFISPYIQGEKLSHHIKIHKNVKEENVKFYAASLVLMIEYLHKNEIFCRNFTPKNILIDKDGYIKLTPFRIENFFQIKKEILAKIEKNEYNSPEVLANNEKKDLKGVDWWNLGIIIFEMIYGIPPFYTDNEKKMKEFINGNELIFPKNPIISERLKDLIIKLLNKKYEERLGYNNDSEEIKNHVFFDEFNFKDLFEKKLESPYNPNIEHIENNNIIEDKYTYEDLIKNGLMKTN